ncbi:MAG: AbrB/MazE/SpoVT family DNA-binding domain-containing protein [Herpetosiphonaceae bacterium]|nr:AbrB/MazE/SpoVT family DNA-binding domain-containing protein [Herpetosiphonaceae bacterium]
MRTRVQRWGNSLAVRIPKSFATELHLDHDSEVDLALIGGQLAVTPIIGPTFTLDGLLQGITDTNRHQEIDTGVARGHEEW